MFREFLKRQAHVFHIQLWPDRIKISEMNTARSIEGAPLVAFDGNDAKKTIRDIGSAAQAHAALENVNVMNPLYSEGYVISDIDGAAAVINHHLHLLIKELPGKIFSPLMIFQPMQAVERGLCVDDGDVASLLSKKCGARNVLIMEPDEYLDLDGAA